MTYSDFKFGKTAADGTQGASVLETSGVLFWKRTRRVEIYKPSCSGYWRLLDGGEWCYGTQVERMAEAAEAAKKLAATE